MSLVGPFASIRDRSAQVCFTPDSDQKADILIGSDVPIGDIKRLA
jgi:hypothetical protein